MAAPTKTVPHPGRPLAALVALIVIMLLGTLGGELSSPGQRHRTLALPPVRRAASSPGQWHADASGGMEIVVIGIPATYCGAGRR